MLVFSDAISVRIELHLHTPWRRVALGFVPPSSYRGKRALDRVLLKKLPHYALHLSPLHVLCTAVW